MDIKLSSREKFRATTNGGKSFIDIRAGKDEMCLSASVYEMHFLQIRRKQREIKVFSFPSLVYYKEFDFEFWNDAEVIWQNFDKNMK